MNNKILWPTVVYNSINIICWTVLAVIFNKWWVIFFAVLFMDISTKVYYRFCDKCGKHSPYANSYNEALKKAQDAGWVHYVDGNRDYCPDCQREE